MIQAAIDLAVLLLLIGGIWQFRTPRGARKGNWAAAVALLLGMAAVLYRHPVSAPVVVITFLALGSLAGWTVAVRVNMIQIPAMVAFQHGAGGIAAFIVSFVELTREQAVLTPVGKVAGIAGMIVGAATFSGSFIAAGKLANLIKQTPVVFPRHNWWLAGLVAAIVVLSTVALGISGAPLLHCLVILILVSAVLGAVFAIRVGGADMPVLISFLNATAGLAAGLCGIVIGNRLLIACGATVAASGSILTRVMCAAMNRSILKVFAGTRGGTGAPGLGQVPAPSPLPLSSKEEPFAAAVGKARDAKSVIIVPGYGMALAQAQFEVARLAGRLEALGKEVNFAIHPVAGRMPGHMNVLLAEAEIDYGKLLEMEDVNPRFKETDLVFVVGACDVVNPAAIQVADTPISGMPILMVHEARSVVVCNLDLRPGYSGVDNPLYADPRTILLLGNAKETLGRLLGELD